jgi:hypothetical protein
MRSAAYLAATLPAHSRGRLDELALFEQLRELSRHPEAHAIDAVVEIPETPTFVPHLLRLNPESPKDMLRIALEQRNTGPVLAYRTWRRRLERDAARGWEPDLGGDGSGEIDELVRHLNQAPGSLLKLSPKLKIDLAIPSPSLSFGEIELPQVADSDDSIAAWVQERAARPGARLGSAAAELTQRRAA